MDSSARIYHPSPDNGPRINRPAAEPPSRVTGTLLCGLPLLSEPRARHTLRSTNEFLHNERTSGPTQHSARKHPLTEGCRHTHTLLRSLSPYGVGHSLDRPCDQRTKLLAESQPPGKPIKPPSIEYAFALRLEAFYPPRRRHSSTLPPLLSPPVAVLLGQWSSPA